VTGCTAAGYRRVVHESDRPPCGGRMAVHTCTGGNDMVSRFLRSLDNAVR
jgi:hypothetical protein